MYGVVNQSFSEIPSSVMVNEGESVLLRCTVRNQQGKAQWTKDGFALGEYMVNNYIINPLLPTFLILTWFIIISLTLYL